MQSLRSLGLNPSYRAPSSWWEHVPIAHWLVEQLQPGLIVELGSHYGVSFFSFCEAAAAFSDAAAAFSAAAFSAPAAFSTTAAAFSAAAFFAASLRR